MAAMPAVFNQAINKIAFTFAPAQTRWNALETGQRRLLVIGALLLALGFLMAFVWLPAVRTREMLNSRIPQLEAQLAVMRSQAIEVTALGRSPISPVAPRRIADVTALQSVFGPDAQITAVQNGFRITIPAISYANWWDKTGDAASQYALTLRAATMTRLDKPAKGEAVIAVDMQLAGVEKAAGTAAAAATPPPSAKPAPPGK